MAVVPASAVAAIQPLAWELPYAAGVAVKSKKKKKEKSIYPDKTFLEKDTCTRMFTAVLFTIAKAWKQAKCPSTDE